MILNVLVLNDKLLRGMGADRWCLVHTMLPVAKKQKQTIRPVVLIGLITASPAASLTQIRDCASGPGGCEAARFT